MLLLALACHRVPDVPEDVGELLIYAFEHMGDDDPDALAAAAPGLLDFARGHERDASVNDRSYIPPRLTTEHLGGLDQPDGTSPEDQIPVALVGWSRHPWQSHHDLRAETNLVCIEADSAKYAQRTHLSDLDCYLDDSCEDLETVAEIRRETLLFNLWMDLFHDFRDVEVDGEELTYGRAHIEEAFPSDNGNASFDQYFMLEIFAPEGDETLRLVSVWSSVSMTGLTDGIYTSSVLSGIDEGLQNTDDYQDGILCGNDRDAEYQR